MRFGCMDDKNLKYNEYLVILKYFDFKKEIKDN